MKKPLIRQFFFVLVLLLALGSIAGGIYKVWESFTEFDEAILNEKDSQYYSLIRSDDINIENSVDSFVREAETFFQRAVLKQLRDEWAQSEDRDPSKLSEYFGGNTLIANPVYGDMIMFNKDKMVVSAGGDRTYTFLTDKNERNFRICIDQNGKYYMAYEYEESKNVRYDALIDLEQLYKNSLGNSMSRDMMLLDSTMTIILRSYMGEVVITTVDTPLDENVSQCRDYIMQCQTTQTSGGITMDLTDESGEKFSARMVVFPTKDTINGVFAIGITANYEDAVRPSREAAEKILIYGGIGVAGILIILFMLLFMRRTNTTNRMELEALRKKNETMEELNQNVLALAHHQRLETIGTMTASIAHDFNNLLTPIMGYSMMSMEMLPDDQAEIQDYLMEVYNASVKAKDMVTRLADLSKKGKEENFVDLDPDEVITNALKVTLPAKPKNVDVKVRFRAGDRRIRGDNTQISQLIINLVLNAYDAMREKGGSLFVSTAAEEKRIVMRFRDTGSGMDAETVARIFDPFFTTKESGKGTGLGLAIVAQVAESHDGKVYVDSTPGKGTEFRISFPAIEVPHDVDRAKTIQISTAELKALLKGEKIPE